VAGDHRGNLRVAGIPFRGGPARQPARLTVTRRPGSRPRVLRLGGAVQVAELVQGQVQLNLRRLAGPVRQPTRRDEPPAGFFEGVVTALGGSPRILRAGFLPQRLQHRRQGRRAPGRQIPGDPARTAERHA
jgi:hypothetical protein